MASEIAAILADSTRFNQVTQQCFKEDDIDSSGFIDNSELQRVLIKVAKCTGASPPTPEEVRLTMQETDLNSDGTVNFEEYQVFARKLLTAIHQRMSSQSAQEQPSAKPPAKTAVLASPKEPAQVPASPQHKAKEITAELAPHHVPEQIPPRVTPPMRTPPSSQQVTSAIRPEAKRMSKAEALSQRMTDFEEYLNYWRLNDAVMQIFAEVESKKIEPAQVYQYTATRLRQFGKDSRFLKH
jgi:hypothetical protein